MIDFESLLRERRVHVEPPQEPPQPPERDGDGPRRIHVTIEIVERQPPPKPRSHRFGTTVLIMMILLLLGALAGCTVAHAQTNGPMRYEHWQDTNGSHGEVRRQGRTTDWIDYGPRGEVRRCHQYYVGDTAVTSCN